jgi:hypothetical protein
VIVVHVHSVLLSIAAGALAAAAWYFIPDLEYGLFAIAVLGCAVGYFCIGPSALLAGCGIVPMIALAAWLYLTKDPDWLEPGWYYLLALAGTVFAGAVYVSAIQRQESDPQS